jgi:hypothetical protein
MPEPITADGRQDERASAAAPAAAPPGPPGTAVWGMAQRIAFRFVFVYLVLYCLPFPLDYLNLAPTDWLAELYIRAQHALTPWVGSHVLHLARPIVYQPTGSGDTMADYVWALCLLALAGLATLAWTLLDRRRREHRGLHRWLRIYVRYWLAWILLSYGMSKVIQLQMPTPMADRLEEPLGQFSPMGLLWTFMGYSTAYECFAGAMEVLGGVLLFFRRTATLGALFTVAVIGNVVLLNFCYDVPVKLFSLHLLLAALFLAAPDARRLACVLVLNRPAAPVRFEPYWRARWARIAQLVLKTAIVGYALYSSTSQSVEGYRAMHPTGPDVPPLFGVYQVEEFVRNGKPVPAVATEESRWLQIGARSRGYVAIKLMAGPKQVYNVSFAKSAVTFTSLGTQDRIGVFTWSRPAPLHVVLQGTWSKLPLAVRLRELPVGNYPLMKRGFHWIQELPFNR